MIDLVLSSKKCSEDFIKNKVPKILKNILLNRCNKYTHINMKQYLEDNYKLDIKEIILAVCNNIVVSRVGSDYILALNSKSKKNDVSLDSLTRLVDYGNREVRGCELFDSGVRYLKSRINVIYYYSLVQKESGLWR